METIPLYQLEARLIYLESRSKYLQSLLEMACNAGNNAFYDWGNSTLTSCVNEIGKIKIDISLMQQCGETDEITTDYALKFIGCNYTKESSGFFINS